MKIARNSCVMMSLRVPNHIKDDFQMICKDKYTSMTAEIVRFMNQSVLEAQIEERVRAAHLEGYMAGVGDSEDYDHDAREMEKQAWNDFYESLKRE